MTPEELAAIRTRAEASPPGPWRVGFADGSGPTFVTAADDDVVVWGGPDSYGIPQGVQRPEAGEFIAHARTDILALLDEIDRLRVPRDVTRDEIPSPEPETDAS